MCVSGPLIGICLWCRLFLSHFSPHLEICRQYGNIVNDDIERPLEDSVVKGTWCLTL